MKKKHKKFVDVTDFGSEESRQSNWSRGTGRFEITEKQIDDVGVALLRLFDLLIEKKFITQKEVVSILSKNDHDIEERMKE